MGAPSNYDELQASILEWLDDDAANINPAECIGLAEARLNRLLDTPEMEASATLTAAAVIALPADFRAARAVHIEADPRVVLDQVTPAVLRGRYAFQTVGMPEVFAIVGEDMILGPAPDSAYDISLTYKAAIPALSDDNQTNWLIQTHPDAYLVASLMIAEARGWNDPRAASLKGWWDEILAEIGLVSNRKRYGAAPLRLRSPVRWGG